MRDRKVDSLFSEGRSGLQPKVKRLKNLMEQMARLLMGATVLALVVHFSTLSPRPATRGLASMAFPQVREANDADEILNAYTPYLNYVLEIGRQTDAPRAQRLASLYTTLRKVNPVGAARFLKGLRFEMVEKLELTGTAPERASTQSPEMRRWVAKFIKEWNREADEHLFRAIALRASSSRKK